MCSHCLYLEFRNYAVFNIINEKLAIIIVTLIPNRDELKLIPQDNTLNTMPYTLHKLSRYTIRIHSTATRLLLRETSVHYCLYYLPGFLLVHVSALTEIWGKNKWVLNAVVLYCLKTSGKAGFFIRWCLCKVAIFCNDQSIVEKLKRLQFLVKNNNYVSLP